MKYILMSYKENDLSKETLQAISEINGTNYVELTKEELIWLANICDKMGNEFQGIRSGSITIPIPVKEISHNLWKVIENE